MPHKIGFYVRVSTDLQVQVVEGSLESQKFRLNSYVDLRNSQEKNWGSVVEVYVEEGISAETVTKRPVYQRMIRDIKSGKINLIIVTDLSRLSRTVLDFCVLLKELSEYGAKFFSLKEQFDTSTPIGEMMVLNMMNLAQFERKQTAERVSLNFNARALRGLRNGGIIPLGFQVPEKDPSRLVIHEAEAVLVRRIFELFLEEKTLTRTIKRLHTESIRPKQRGHSLHYHSNSGRWTIVSLNSLLRNRSYIGERVVNARNQNADPSTLKPYERFQVVQAAWDGIVDKEIFNQVQAILDSRNQEARLRLSDSKSSLFLLSGIIFCGDCGRPYVGSSGNGEGGKYRYYIHRAIPGHTVNCSVPRFRAEGLEDHILNHLSEVLQREGYLEKIGLNYRYLLGSSDEDRRQLLSQTKDEIVKIDTQIQGAINLAALPEAATQMDEILKRMNELKTSKNGLLERLSELEVSEFQTLSEQEFGQILVETSKDLKRLSRVRDGVLKREILKSAIAGIYIKDFQAGISYWTKRESTKYGLKISKKKAPDAKSGAKYFTGYGRKSVKFLPSFRNVLDRDSRGSDQAVKSSYVVWSGALIRT